MERDDNLRSGMAKRQKKNIMAFLHLIPIDVLVEIFLRLPAKSLARFVGVSKMCASIIRGRHFIRSYSFRFSTQKEPRFLFAATNSYRDEWYLFLKATVLAAPLSPVRKPPPRHQKLCYAHGLMMFLHGDDQVITNPSIGKSITLPSVKTSDMVIKSFLGYDPTDAQHKVLCFTNGNGFCQNIKSSHWEEENCSWRRVQCSIVPHSPGDGSVCVDGVLYYVASDMKNLPLVVGFHLKSETFEVLSVFPKDVGYGKCTTLINYHGKAALATRYYGNVFDLWVLKDTTTQRWSKEQLTVPRVTRIYQLDFEILAASELGKAIFAPIKFDEIYVYFLDGKSNQIKIVELEGSTEHKFRDFSKVFTFLPYVECVVLI